MIPRKLQRLAEEFRRGIAEAIGVSPEDINPDVVEKWVREWTRAFLTPEAFRRIWGHESPSKVEVTTTELIRHILSVKKTDKVSEIGRKRKGL